MARPSNPIEQRIIQFYESWETTRSKKEISLIRIQSDESNMVETFIYYLFGVDNDVTDVPMILDIPFEGINTYSTELLHEIEELIYVWNNVEDNNTGKELQQVNWKPDYSKGNAKNPAQLFVENINHFNNFLELDDDAFLVVIIDEEAVEKKQHLQWIQNALDCGLDKGVKLLVVDTPDDPYFKSITNDNQKTTEVIVPNFSMGKAMQQIAVMGNPNDPLVQYRKSFNLLTEAVSGRKKKQVKKHSNECFNIVKQNTAKDPHWHCQYIVVYTLLVNDQIGYKNYKRAIELATKSVEIAEGLFAYYKEDFIPNKLLAQALMTRGSLHAITKEWQKSASDFNLSFNHLSKTDDVILAIESARMNGYANSKSRRLIESKDILLGAYTLSKKTPPTILKNTTFGGVIEYLFDLNIDEYIDKKEYTEFFESIYGSLWRVDYMAWKKPTEIEDLQPNESIIA